MYLAGFYTDDISPWVLSSINILREGAKFVREKSDMGLRRSLFFVKDECKTEVANRKFCTQ
jgi:hypothetical protein